MAHGEAEESQVYPSLEKKDAIDEHEAEHGEKEHDEEYWTLLPLLEADDVTSDEFSQAIHEFSDTWLHHLDEEEREILNPARIHVTDADRARLGAAWADERNRLLDAGCGSSRVRRLVQGHRDLTRPRRPRVARADRALDRSRRVARRDVRAPDPVLRRVRPDRAEPAHGQPDAAGDGSAAAGRRAHARSCSSGVLPA